jgi:hypothetical protein
MRGVGDFPRIEKPFPPVPYALRALAAIETSTGSGVRPRRPTLSLNCTCRTLAAAASICAGQGRTRAAAPFRAESKAA